MITTKFFYAKFPTVMLCVFSIDEVGLDFIPSAHHLNITVKCSSCKSNKSNLPATLQFCLHSSCLLLLS